MGYYVIDIGNGMKSVQTDDPINYPLAGGALLLNSNFNILSSGITNHTFIGQSGAIGARGHIGNVGPQGSFGRLGTPGVQGAEGAHGTNGVIHPVNGSNIQAADWYGYPGTFFAQFSTHLTLAGSVLYNGTDYYTRYAISQQTTFSNGILVAIS